jgi:adenosine deaminase
MNEKHIAITTIGQNWLIIPEVIGFLRPDFFDFYKHHSSLPIFRKDLEWNLRHSVDVLYIISTDNSRLDQLAQQTVEWFAAIQKNDLKVIFIAPEEIGDISSPADAQQMKGCIVETVAHGKLLTGQKGKLFLSLTGGRKTMSSDLQFAASLFGCDRLFHILDNITSDISAEIKSILPSEFYNPPSSQICSSFFPMMMGPFSNQVPLEILLEYTLFQKIDKIQYSECVEIYKVKPNIEFLEEIENIFYSGLHLSVNLQYSEIYQKFPEHFKSIYSFHRDQLFLLSNLRLGQDRNNNQEDLALIRKLPKVDLHFHLGGSLSTEEMIEASMQLSGDIEKFKNSHSDYHTFIERCRKYIQRRELGQLKEFLHSINSDFQFDSSKANLKVLRNLFKSIPEPFTVAGFLSAFDGYADVLDQFIYGDLLEGDNFRKVGIQKYESLGDLQGSALLQDKRTIQYTVTKICQKAIKENVKLLEIRCSPINYTRGGLSGLEVYKTICDVIHQYKDTIQIRLNIIASRHGKMSKIYEHIELIDEIFKLDEKYRRYLAGIDLAGDEKHRSPEELRLPFLSAMEKNLHITIHAGETEDVHNIWQAVYHLNAERIGHGLTLKNDHSLMKKILDRKIGIEMCPSSNDQIVGFRNFIDSGDDLNIYPLREYLNSHLKITINTDNTGISRTDISNEYLKACLLTEGGLSLLEVMQIIKNGIDTCFLTYEEKKELTSKIEKELIELLRREILCQNSYWRSRVTG